MKLRNKKTGEIKTIEEIIREAFINNELETLKRIDDNWEDYNPKEPLIKDEKIRKAVRAWAEANNIEKVWLEYCDNKLAFRDEYFNCENGKHICIVFVTNDKYPSFDRCNTIEELCGEEECES